MRGALTVLALVTLGALGVGLLQLDAPLVVILCNLRLHAIMVLILVAVALIGLRARWRALMLCAAAAIAFVQMVIVLAPVSRSGASAGGPALEVISLNVSGDDMAKGEQIVRHLAASGADIAFIQEAAPLAPHLELLSQTFPFHAGCTAGPCDILILSTRPLTRVQPHHQDQRQFPTWADPGADHAR